MFVKSVSVPLVSPLFDPDRSRELPFPARLSSLSFHFNQTTSVRPPAHVWISVLSQSQSVPVLPLRGTRPEATQVVRKARRVYSTSPSTSLPAQSALFQPHPSTRRRCPRLCKSQQSTQADCTILKLVCDSWKVGQKRLEHKERTCRECECSCEERSGSGGFQCFQEFTGHPT